MKTVFIFFLLLCSINVFSQSDSCEKGFSLNFGIGYLIPYGDNKPNLYKLRSGIAIKPSIQLKTSKNVNLFTEFSYSRLKDDNLLHNTYSYVDYILINLGLKVYPESKAKIYFKPSLGLAYSNNYFSYSINGGLGNDIKISKKINIFIEAEISFHRLIPIPFHSWYSFCDLILSSGINYKL